MYKPENCYLFNDVFLPFIVFGIAYKPFKKANETYKLPSGPVFEDEDEFKNELKTFQMANINNTALVNNVEGDEDDEFDITPSETVGGGNGGNTNSTGGENMLPVIDTAIDLAVRNAAIFAAEQAVEEEKMIFEMMQIKISEGSSSGSMEGLVTSDFIQFANPIDDIIGKSETTISSSINMTNDIITYSDGSSGSSSVRLAARQALDDIVSVYSSGLGDQDVKMIGLSTPNRTQSIGALQSKTKTNSSINGKLSILSQEANKGVETIMEEDEEEAEREEQREQEVTDKIKSDQINQMLLLEAEWNSLDDDKDTSLPKVVDMNEVNATDSFEKVSYAVALNYFR